MRKAISFIASHILYWVGLFFSFLGGLWSYFFPNEHPEWAERLYGTIIYRPYNWFMVTSYEIEEWAGTEYVWEKINETQSETAP